MFEAVRRIDCAALRRNALRMQQLAAPARIIAVVKADAYGHGALTVSRELAQIGVEWFAVARLAEVMQLRQAEIEGRILLLENMSPGIAEQLVQLDATPILSSVQQVAAWADATRNWSRALAVHLKVNTGLNRLGVEIDELTPSIEAIEQAPGLWLEGIATHFSESEVLEGDVTVEQQVRFSDALAQLPSATRDRVMVHAANSCATRHWPNTHFDAVRCGGALFGLDLAAAGNEAEQPAHALDPVMSVVAPVVQVRSIEAGQRVGYGGTWQAQSDATLAVVPLGYADGYPSHRSTDSACSKTVLPDPPHLLIAGHRCPLVGRVSMDRITVDVSRIAGRIQEGDEAVVLGEQAGHRITASQLARWSDSSLYEVTTRFSRRLPLEIRASPES